MRNSIGARARQLPTFALVLSAGLWAAACGPSSAGVAGKVTYQGKTVRGGIVTFYGPNQWTGSSPISEDGAYSIAKVPKGTVQITVETKMVKPNPMALKMPRPPADAPVQGSLYEGQNRADRYVPIPDRYADKDQSGLTFDATGGKEAHNIELK
jgi:hypothetical protein